MACVDHTICPRFIHAGRNAHFRCLACLSEGIICVDLLRHGSVTAACLRSVHMSACLSSSVAADKHELGVS